jgi:hypothetical protein
VYLDQQRPALLQIRLFQFAAAKFEPGPQSG